MRKLQVQLSGVESVKKFVNIISKYDTDFELISDKYIIDAKSIMGIFSLDLSGKLLLVIHSDEEAIAAAVQEFTVDEPCNA